MCISRMNMYFYTAMFTFVLFFMISFLFGVEGASFVSKSHYFDHFVFTQSWPQTVCFEGLQDGHKCKVNRKVTGWIIHGLWPTEGKRKGPVYCNDKDKFNKTAILPIETQLDTKWPNLYVDNHKYEFWEHEWSRHGTCAVSVAETSNEYYYFKKGLDLNTEFNLKGILEELGYTPRYERPYNIKELSKRLTDKLGIEPIISCFKYHRKNYLAEIEICLSKQFQMIDCPESVMRRHHTLYFKSLNNLSETKNTVFDKLSELQDCESDDVFYPVIQYN